MMMTATETLKIIENNLFFRFPKLAINAFEVGDRIDIYYDPLVTEKQTNELTKYTDNYMSKNYPDVNYKLIRRPF